MGETRKMPKKGYKQTLKHRKKYKRKGQNNPFYDKHHTNKTKRNIRKKLKGRVNKNSQSV